MVWFGGGKGFVRFWFFGIFFGLFLGLYFLGFLLSFGGLSALFC